MEVGYLLEAVSDGKQRRILVQVAHECEAGRCSWTSDIVVNIFVHFGWRRSVCVANPIRYNHCGVSGQIRNGQLRPGIERDQHINLFEQRLHLSYRQSARPVCLKVFDRWKKTGDTKNVGPVIRSLTRKKTIAAGPG